jgi:hypothetical protein
MENPEGWPLWRHGPNGEEELFNCAEDVPAGWQDRPFPRTVALANGLPWGDDKPATVVKKVVIGKEFDHDNSGTPGGSTAPEKTDELKEARAEYQAKMGKRAFPGWDVAEIRRRMEPAAPAIDESEF